MYDTDRYAYWQSLTGVMEDWTETVEEGLGVPARFPDAAVTWAELLKLSDIVSV